MKFRFWKKKEIEVQEVENDFDFNRISESDISRMMKFGKPTDTIGNFKSKTFIELPYGIIKKELPAKLKVGNVSEAVEMILKISFPDFEIQKANANDIICFFIWIKNQMQFIKNIEEQNLQSEPEPEMLAAGINRLNEFGIAPLVEKISKDWNFKPEEVERTPYFKIYEKIKLDKVQGEINKNYQKIIEEKAKRKR